jgi:hypothetical protein
MIEWNVYKVFSNGKRAKMPYTSFTAEEESHFFSNILPTLSDKLRDRSWLVIDSGKSQDRQDSAPAEIMDIFKKKISVVCTKIVADKGIVITNNKFVSCLMMNEDTGWKWQLCLASAGTHRFHCALSDKFENRNAAVAWVDEQYALRVQ